MDEETSFFLRRSLRSKLTRFLRYSSPWRGPLAERLLSENRHLPIYIFGGAVRDIAIFGRAARPRDIDLVVGDIDGEELASVLAPFVRKKTRFGGLRLVVQGVQVDIWPLSETWAFRNRLVNHIEFSRLPETTFLNVDAVAVELIGCLLKPGEIYSKGFFEGIRNRVIDVNFAINPYPEKVVVRSLSLARRIEFSVGPRLAELVADVFS